MNRFMCMNVGWFFFFSLYELFSVHMFLPQENKRGRENEHELIIVFRFFLCLFAECQALLLLRQPSEGPGGSKLAFGNEPGSAVGGQQQQAESGAGGFCSAR